MDLESRKCWKTTMSENRIKKFGCPKLFQYEYVQAFIIFKMLTVVNILPWTLPNSFDCIWFHFYWVFPFFQYFTGLPFYVLNKIKNWHISVLQHFSKLLAVFYKHAHSKKSLFFYFLWKTRKLSQNRVNLRKKWLQICEKKNLLRS